MLLPIHSNRNRVHAFPPGLRGLTRNSTFTPREMQFVFAHLPNAAWASLAANRSSHRLAYECGSLQRLAPFALVTPASRRLFRACFCLCSGRSREAGPGSRCCGSSVAFVLVAATFRVLVATAVLNQGASSHFTETEKPVSSRTQSRAFSCLPHFSRRGAGRDRQPLLACPQLNATARPLISSCVTITNMLTSVVG